MGCDRLTWDLSASIRSRRISENAFMPVMPPNVPAPQNANGALATVHMEFQVRLVSVGQIGGEREVQDARVGAGSTDIDASDRVTVVPDRERLVACGVSVIQEPVCDSRVVVLDSCDRPTSHQMSPAFSGHAGVSMRNQRERSLTPYSLMALIRYV